MNDPASLPGSGKFKARRGHCHRLTVGESLLLLHRGADDTESERCLAQFDRHDAQSVIAKLHISAYRRSDLLMDRGQKVGFLFSFLFFFGLIWFFFNPVPGLRIVQRVSNGEKKENGGAIMNATRWQALHNWRKKKAKG